MNKSKFLKKSLAVLLSVMMVVAMIPLGASAAWPVSNTDDVVEVTTDAGTIDKTGTTAGTLKLPYDKANDTTLSVLFQNTVTSVTVKIDDAAETTTPVVKGTVATITVPPTAKQVVFTPSKGDTKGAAYTITVNKPAPSRDLTLKEARIGTGDTAIKGVVSGTTVTVTVPWGSSSSQTVSLVPNTPPTGVEKVDVNVTLTDGTGTATGTITSQAGTTEIYTVTVNEAPALTSLKVAGVEAKWIEANPSATPAVTAHYEVKLPIGTKMTKEDGSKAEMPVVFTIADLGSAKWEAAGESEEAVTSGKSVKIGASNTLKLTHKNGNTKNYTVEVSVTPNDKAAVESFTLSDGTYTAEGKVSGETLTAELPFSATLNPVTAVITASEGAVVTAASGSVSGPTNGKYTISGLDLSADKTVRVTVTSADGNKAFYYSLSATKADNRNNSNTVDSLKMTLGTGDDAVECPVSLSGNTFTYTVPYATGAAAVKAATFTGAYPSGSTVTPNPVAVPGAYDDDDLKTPVTFTVTSETGRVATYTIKFAKSPAESGKTLSGVSFANAATASAVKTENTFAATVSGKKLTVTFPYSAENNKGNYGTLVPQFTLSKGAKLYAKDNTEVKSGYWTKEDAAAKPPLGTEGNPKTTPLTLTNLANEYVFTVADETAVFELDTKGTTMAAIKADEENLAKHVTEITVEVKYAEPQTGAALTGITDKAGKVTGAMSGSKLTITVPGSYVNDASKEIELTWNASPMAVVKAGALDLNAAGNKFLVTSTGTGDDTVYSIKEKNGSAFTDVSVTNEADTNTRKFTVEVKANPIQTGALITAAKANDTTATVNNRDWTITATVPATTDLTKVKLALTGSTMADVAVVEAAADTPVSPVTDEHGDAIADTYDLSDLEHPLRVKVVAEDGATKNYYTLVIKTEEISFTDVKDPNAWYYDDVYAAANAGIVSGYEDKTFKPTNNIKRKDFAVMVANMMGADLSKYTTSAFSDVAHDYAEKAIAYCGETGIIAGKAPGKFAPNDTVTREQAATIVARALKLQSTSANKFADDASISSWASTGVYACVASGIIEGIGNNTFAPKKNLTRAQAARILVLALNQK